MKTRCLIVLLSLFLFVSCGEKRTNPLIKNLDQSWVVTTDTLNIKMQVDVPSVIQADMYENGLIPHPYKSNVEPQLLWIPQHEWTYTLDFVAEDYILGPAHTAPTLRRGCLIRCLCHHRRYSP